MSACATCGGPMTDDRRGGYVGGSLCPSYKCAAGQPGVVPEIVICAAVRFNGKVWRGNRHPHAIAAMRDEISYTMTRKQMDEAKVDTEQGFVTSLNRYVDREEGLKIQLAAGIPSAAVAYSDQLFSEDLY